MLILPKDGMKLNASNFIILLYLYLFLTLELYGTVPTSNEIPKNLNELVTR